MIETERSILEDLEMLGDGLSRMEYLLECGKAAPGIPEEERIGAFLVKDCQTKTWIDHSWKDDRLNIRSDSLSMIVKGALFLLGEIYCGRTRSEINAYHCSLTEIPLFTELLYPDQLTGIKSIIKQLSE